MQEAHQAEVAAQRDLSARRMEEAFGEGELETMIKDYRGWEGFRIDGRRRRF